MLGEAQTSLATDEKLLLLCQTDEDRGSDTQPDPGVRLYTVQQLIERGKRERRGEEGGREGGREGCLFPPQPVSQSQRGRTTGHNGALQRLAESCNLA